MTQNSPRASGELRHSVINFCRHIAGSARITAVSLLDNYPTETSTAKSALQVTLVIRKFQPKLMSYVNVIDGRNVVVFAVDQSVFERDVKRGLLGEALAGALILPYKAVTGKDYLHEQEVMLKKRLILELVENLVSSFPELSDRFQIRPEYFMYEALLNRVRLFPPLAYCAANFLHDAVSQEETASVLNGYLEALGQLGEEKKLILSQDYVTISQKLVSESKSPRVRLTNISKNAPRALFTSLFEVFPQFLNFYSQKSEAILKQKLSLKKRPKTTLHFVDPQRYLFVPTAGGLVSLTDGMSIEDYARKMLFKGQNGRVKLERIGGVLNDVYLIKVNSDGGEKKVLVKRFKDWSGFKWFPLTLWSLGAKTFAVLGRSRLEKECAISEILRHEGFNVPKLLHVSHSERLLFMEFVDGENLSESIKRIAASRGKQKIESDLSRISRVGEIMAQVHSLNVTLGDTKPENVIVSPDDKVFLLDFEQASRGGDKSWDIAVFLYYAGHYLPFVYNQEKGELIANAFIRGYLKGSGDVNAVRCAADSKYTRIFSVFTMPSVMLAMSNSCKKTGCRGN